LRKLGADGEIILEWILKKYGMRVWIGLKWLRIRSSSGIL